jgi:hypothetical protein
MCGMEGSRQLQAQRNSVPSIHDSYLTMLYFCVIIMRFIINIRSKKAGNIVQHNTEARSCNKFCGGRAINTTYSECVFVVLVIQHAKHMRRSKLSSVVWFNLPYYLAFSYIYYEFWKQKTKLEHKICMLIFFTTLKYLSL